MISRDTAKMMSRRYTYVAEVAKIIAESAAVNHMVDAEKTTVKSQITPSRTQVEWMALRTIIDKTLIEDAIITTATAT
jgi:hypothetical protein